MAKIDSIKNKLGDILYPKTLTKAVYEEGTNNRLDNILNEKVPLTMYNNYVSTTNAQLAQIAQDANNVTFRLNQALVYSTFKLNKDANDIFTELQYKRADGTLYLKSILSGTSPEYATRTETEYEADGITVKATRIYTITYTDGKVVSEVLQ